MDLKAKIFEAKRLAIEEPNPIPEFIERMIRRKENKYYPFLYHLAKLTKPKFVVELGTNKGTGALHFKFGYPEAIVITIDKVQFNQRFLLKQNIYATKSDTRDSQNLFFVLNKVDILFIDSLHTYAQVVAELELWGSQIKENGILLMDDIRLNTGMTEAWNLIELKDKFEFKELHPAVSFGVAIWKN
ncbi:MAG: class I SAM-dependent methyltransferase [Ignavibacteria bacterium]|nr:class I SAM-dependent methyltransferase [Ignavibacteria bacterium]